MKADHKRKFPLVCERCGAPFMGHRATARFCTRSCRSLSMPHPKRASLRERFERGLPAVRDPDACWLWASPWTGVQPHYGVIRNENDRLVAVHRLAFEYAFGAIPEGMDIDHACHNRDPACPGGHACFHRRCVNPAHLEAVTHAENIRRSPQVKENMRRAQRIMDANRTARREGKV